MTRARFRALALDAGLAIAVGVGLVAATQRRSYGGPHRPPWDDGSGSIATAPLTLSAPIGLLIIVAAAAVAVRRSRPELAFIASVIACGGYLFAGGTLPAALAAPAITLVSLTLSGTKRHHWLPWSLALIPMLWAGSWRQPYLGLARPATYLGILFAMALTIVPALAVMVRTAGRAAASARHTEELRRVAYAERLRIAREIHDVVGHSLSLISLQSGVALHVLETNPAQARESLEAIRSASRSSLSEVRRALDVFRLPDDTDPLAPSPSLDDLRTLVESVRSAGHHIRLAYAPAIAEGVPQAVQQVAYRIAQESLTNVVRHAPGAAVWVEVEVDHNRNQVVVCVRDDGAPPGATLVEGNGIRGMRERVAALRGGLDVEAVPEGGVRVRARLPISATETGPEAAADRPGSPT